MRIISCLQNHYPERLGKLFCVNAPAIFSTFYSLVSGVIDPVTREKIVFVPKGQTIEVLSQFMDPEVVEAEYGGTSEYKYSHEEFRACTKAEEARWNWTTASEAAAGGE